MNSVFSVGTIIVCCIAAYYFCKWVCGGYDESEGD